MGTATLRRPQLSHLGCRSEIEAGDNGDLQMQLREYLTNDDKWEYQSFDVTAVGACVLAPAIMWVAEMIKWEHTGSPRGSISAYHSMLPAGAFFIPLTVAVMLFVVNGWLYRGHRIHVAMSAFLLGVILFDHDGASAAAHFTFAGYFFVVGAFLEAARDSKLPQWAPWRWIAMAPILPFWLLVKRRDEILRLWQRAVEIALPFAILWLLSLAGGWLEDHWLFIAEWVALAVLVIHYLGDARGHAHANAALAGN